MSITGNINELASLTQEIQRLSRQLKDLRQKKHQLESSISKFIESNKDTVKRNICIGFYRININLDYQRLYNVYHHLFKI